MRSKPAARSQHRSAYWVPVDPLAFVASLVASLAWPAATVVIALVFRTTIRSALARPLRRVKAGPLEAEWDETVAEVLIDVAKSPETSDLPAPDRSLVSERLQQIAMQSPRAAVLAAYAEFEEALRRRLTLDGYAEAERRPLSARQMAVVAEERNLISRQTADAIQGATVLRNLAAHGPEDEIDARKALDFLTLADGILYAIGTGAETWRQRHG